jgi:TIR domain-containing protein/SIR2-like protein
MDQNFWETLLVNIDAQRVIPIIGSELLTVTEAGVEKPLHRYIAERIAAERQIPLDTISEVTPLNDVVWQCVEEKKIAREVIYKRIKDLASDARLAIPESLIKLARIRHFKIFVSTTFDSLLERAITQARGLKETPVFTYAPTGWEDLPGDIRERKEPVVYQLLGRASVLPDDYVVTEEDLLEFVYSLQDKNNRPVRLFDELKGNSLLIIGFRFSDWLARFFIRGAKGQKLSLHRERIFLADQLASGDQNLTIFLERFTNNTSEIFDRGAGDFVDELWQRYSEAHPNEQEEIPAQSQLKRQETKKPIIFLSYASEDLRVAQTIRDALNDLGWEVWFDKKDLHHGDNWDIKIEQAIRKCNHFLPIVSQATEEQERSYFRKEWLEGVEAAKMVDESLPFLLPVVLGKLEITNALVPARFQKAQWEVFPNGEITQDFRDDMQLVLRNWHMRRQGRS